MSALAFRPFGEAKLALGESPVWDDRRSLLFCVDIPAPAVHAFGLDGAAAGHWPMPGRFAGSLGLCRSGRLIVALERELVFLDPESGVITPLASVAGMPAGTRLNDGKVGPDGAFHVGSMDNRGPDREPIGSLYRVTADGQVTTQIAGTLKVSNGLAWSPDGRTMFHSDSSDGRIARWDFDKATGAISHRRAIATGIDETTGRPDGAACLADGSYLSAGIYGASLNRWSPEGRLIERIPVPVPTPTMPCFCGPDLRRLVVTSLVPGHGRQVHHNSGRMFVADAPFAGVPIHRFAD
jgi:sugar lactone lactonase YvrE